MSITVDPPTRLPVRSLSVSSLNLLARCPEKWRRRYIDGEYEPASGKMLIGTAAGAAESRHYQRQIDHGEGLLIEEVLDVYSDEWELQREQNKYVFGSDTPGDLKDSGAKALTAYHRDVAPACTPVSVERKFEIAWDGVDWSFVGYIDLEETYGDGSVAVDDLKVIGKKLSQNDADRDPQATSYLMARRAEGNPADEFRFHTMVRTKSPYAEVVATRRTDVQLDSFTDRIFTAAREIHWRASNDEWSYAPPGGWWCSHSMCGCFDSCPAGGLR